MLPRSLFCVLLTACAAPPQPMGPPDAGLPPHRGGAELEACHAVSGPVQTIAALVERLNALPRPVSVPCLVASLPRPLSIVATRGVTSAQPADGSESPRIFILGEGLVTSVVPAGSGGHLIELGEWVTPTRTLKGELQLPVTETLAADAPLTRVEQSNQTSVCGICHRAEAPHDTLAHGYVSAAFRPNPGEELPVDTLSTLHQSCIHLSDTGERCAMFHALFDFGEVRQGAFERQVELFFQ